MLSEANHLSVVNKQLVLTEDNKCQLRLFFAKKVQNIYIQHFTQTFTPITNLNYRQHEQL
jgi:hypothetical protein